MSPHILQVPRNAEPGGADANGLARLEEPTVTDHLADHLHAERGLSDRSSAFGRMVGDWELEWHGFTSTGTPATTRGRLTFGWVLGGRAVQDVWEVPPAVPGDPGVAGHGFHGTTIRVFDVSLGAWRSTWIEPINGRVRRFIGTLGADRIVLLSIEERPHLRWSFRDIKPDSFSWVGEISPDGTENWFEDERMIARRVQHRS